MSEETTQNFPSDDLRGIHARFDSIDRRLTTLEDKVDRRLQETRPIWEQVLAKLDGLETKVDSLETKVDGLEAKVGSIETEVRRGFRRHEHHTEVLAGDVVGVRAAQHDLDRRVEKLEAERPRR
jgi:hypothetical protein